MSLTLAQNVANAIELGPQPCEAHRCVPVPAGSADLTEEDRCGAPHTSLYLIGCTHEHVIELWMCASCSTPEGRIQYCGACFDGDRHICPVLVTLAGAA